MKMDEVRERARIAGVRAGKMRKAEVIAAIQRKEGNQPCFGSDLRYSCPYPECCWRDDCLPPRAERQ